MKRYTISAILTLLLLVATVASLFVRLPVTAADFSSCGNPFSVSHTTAAGVAPVDKTVTYGTVNSSLTGSAKCWITQNLGATTTAATVTESTEPNAGWYWQFNKKQGYQYTTARTPASTWITAISESSEWTSANDPCTLLLDTTWRLPTSTEWTSADANGPWVSYTDTFASVLKLHAAGYLGTAAGALTDRGALGMYWSSIQNSNTVGFNLAFNSGTSSVNSSNSKAYGFSARCVRDSLDSTPTPTPGANINQPVSFPGGIVFPTTQIVTGLKFVDSASDAYYIDPSSSETSLVVAGKVGIGTTSPGQALSVAGTIESTTGGFKFPDGTTQTSAYGVVNCPTGYILVPGSATFGTNDFCVMKYEAKQDANKNPTSTATGTPWASVDWYEAREACKRVGAHLITNPEWMTIARNIEALAINDMDDDANLQLATGHSDNVPAAAQAVTAGSDPVVSGCTLTSTMENASNAYSAGVCEIRGDGSYAGDDNDKGYYLTGQAWSTTGYSAGLANKSQLRTAVLSNGTVIWDIAGNVWEWSDWQCGTNIWYYTAAWVDWTNANVTDYEKYAAGPSGSLTSVNGAGQYYGCSVIGNAAFRGGGWDTAAIAGPFTLYLSHAPSAVTAHIGFRCAK